MASKGVNVLFIDDEVLLLQALRRKLRSMRLEWNMEFVNSAKLALAHIEQNNVDVVVSDIRMPEMSGMVLLKTIQERYPEVVRIILSGYAENNVALRTVGASHQYLAKPCGAELIVDAVYRSINLRAHLSSSSLLSCVTGISNIPTLPDVYQMFMEEASNPTATTNSISAVIERDAGIAATILKLTNSAYLSLPTRMTSIRKAVQFLGLETIRSLVAVAGLFVLADFRRDIVSQVQRIGQEAMATATLARRIALSENLEVAEAEKAFCAGLLSRLGCVLFLMDTSGRLEEYLQKLTSDPQTIVETEKNLFGTTHAHVGAYLLGLWGFADSIVEAVLHQHDPSEAGVKKFNATGAVYVSGSLIGHFSAAQKEETLHQDGVHLNEPYLRELGKLERIGIWKDLCHDSYKCGIAQ